MKKLIKNIIYKIKRRKYFNKIKKDYVKSCTEDKFYHYNLADVGLLNFIIEERKH